MIGREDLLQKEMFATPEARMKPEAAEAFDEVLIPWLMERNRAEIVAEAQKHRILSAPIHAMEDLLHDRHMSDRNVWDDIDHPHTGTVRFPGRPFVMSDSPRPDARRAPLLGEHNEEVLCGELGYTRRDLVVLRGQGVI
jgi:crotonobetainyl-CoA:carnitine CoA-transferase CaiB-like acyl-CoA transferase